MDSTSISHRRGAALAVLGTLALAVLAPSASQASGAAEAEQLVRGTYFESFPFDQARALDADGIAWLTSLLADPDEARTHANTVLALGMSGHSDAFDALAAFAAAHPTRPAAYRTRRAWRVLPQAMGHLAREDPRALAWLAAEAARAAADAGRLEVVWTAIGMAGTAEADAILIAAQSTASPEDAARISRARERCARVANHGANAVFAQPAAGAR